MAFKQLDPEDFVVSSDSVTSTVWSGNSPSLNTYATNGLNFTSSVQNFYWIYIAKQPTYLESGLQFINQMCTGSSHFTFGPTALLYVQVIFYVSIHVLYSITT